MLRGNGFFVKGDTTADFVVVRFLIPNLDWFKWQLLNAIYLGTIEGNWSHYSGNASIEFGIESFIKAADTMTFGLEIGRVDFFAINDKAFLPEYYLPCDGSTHLRSDYPLLWELLPAHLKTETDFNTPLVEGFFPVGAGISPEGTDYEVGEHYGNETHTLSIDEIPAHTHSYEAQTTALALEGTGVPLPTGSVSVTSLTGSNGGGLAHNNIPQAIALIPGIIAK